MCLAFQWGFFNYCPFQLPFTSRGHCAQGGTICVSGESSVKKRLDCKGLYLNSPLHCVKLNKHKPWLTTVNYIAWGRSGEGVESVQETQNMWFWLNIQCLVNVQWINQWLIKKKTDLEEKNEHPGKVCPVCKHDLTNSTSKPRVGSAFLVDSIVLGNWPSHQFKHRGNSSHC